MQDLFSSHGYKIGESKQPSLTGTAMQNVAEFDGYLASTDSFRIRNLTKAVVSLSMILVAIVLLVVNGPAEVNQIASLSSPVYPSIIMSLNFVLLYAGYK